MAAPLSSNAPRLIAAGNPGPMTGAGNNTWLVDGAEPALVDAGVGRPDHVEAVAEALTGRPLARVLVTHGHADHASGIPALRARWPSLVVCAWDDLEPSRTHRLAEGDVLPAGDAALTVVHTPGHAADHVCFWDGAREDLYAGDMLVLGSTVMIPAGRGGHLGRYLESLERLAGLEPARVYPGHGPIITDPGKLIADYIGHREERERQVIAAIAAGHRTAADIARVIYGDLPEGIRGAAELTIAAHLEKLREEGR